MKDVFKFIFLIRYMHHERIKITLIDLYRIWRTYMDYKMIRFMGFREFYTEVINYAIEHMMLFTDGSKAKVYEIIELENNKLING
jgi:hypothetical protein